MHQSVHRCRHLTSGRGIRPGVALLQVADSCVASWAAVLGPGLWLGTALAEPAREAWEWWLECTLLGVRGGLARAFVYLQRHHTHS